MRISSKGEYGLRALLELTHQFGRGPVQTKQISQRQDIPEAYLSQLLIGLRKAGFINSRRGPQGGHSLACPPAEINLSQVITVLEGTMAPMPCAEEGVPSDCPMQYQCVLQEVWQEVGRAIDGVLSNTTLEDLRQRHILRAGRLQYHI